LHRVRQAERVDEELADGGPHESLVLVAHGVLFLRWDGMEPIGNM
jgi:hypothetical protein